MTVVIWHVLELRSIAERSAQGPRSASQGLEVRGVIPRDLPAEVREDARHDLIVKVKSRQVSRANMAKAARAIVTRAWDFMPDRFRNVSIDAPDSAEEGAALIDRMPDESEWSDPASAYELTHE